MSRVERYIGRGVGGEVYLHMHAGSWAVGFPMKGLFHVTRGSIVARLSTRDFMYWMKEFVKLL